VQAAQVGVGVEMLHIMHQEHPVLQALAVVVVVEVILTLVATVVPA